MGKFVNFWHSYLPMTQPYFRFQTTLVNINGFMLNFLCALILWRSGFGLLMGKFCQFLTELSACDTSVFLFQDNNFSKSQQIFSKLEMFVDTVEIWFGIGIGYILSIFDRVISPWHNTDRVLLMHAFILFKIYTKIYIWPKKVLMKNLYFQKAPLCVCVCGGRWGGGGGRGRPGDWAL